MVNYSHVKFTIRQLHKQFKTGNHASNTEKCWTTL